MQTEASYPSSAPFGTRCCSRPVGRVLAARPGCQAVGGAGRFRPRRGLSPGRLARSAGEAVRVWPVRRGREVLAELRFNQVVPPVITDEMIAAAQRVARRTGARARLRPDALASRCQLAARLAVSGREPYSLRVPRR
jgi:hypothetical protein